MSKYFCCKARVSTSKIPFLRKHSYFKTSRDETVLWNDKYDFLSCASLWFLRSGKRRLIITWVVFTNNFQFFQKLLEGIGGYINESSSIPRKCLLILTYLTILERCVLINKKTPMRIFQISNCLLKVSQLVAQEVKKTVHWGQFYTSCMITNQKLTEWNALVYNHKESAVTH